MTSTLDSRTRSTPGTRATCHHQLAELEPLLGVAVVADADPGHHHLGLAAATRSAASARIALAGRERAAPRTVGMMQ